MIELSSYVPEETPVDDVRRIREQRSMEVGNDVGRLVARSLAEAQAEWDALLDAKAAFEHKSGERAKLLRLPSIKAYRLVPLLFKKLKLTPDGILQGGIREVEKQGLLGMRVELLPIGSSAEISFE